MRKLANLGYSKPLCRIADVLVAAGFRADLCMHLIALVRESCIPDKQCAGSHEVA